MKASEARHQEYLAMLESELQERVIELANLYGWFVHAERPARTEKGWRTPIMGDKGFPDLVLLRRRIPYPVQCIIAELKSHGGKPSPAQSWWLNLWRLLPGAEVYIWRPQDLESGAIGEALR